MEKPSETKPVQIVLPVSVVYKMKRLAKKRGMLLSTLWETAAVKYLAAERQQRIGFTDEPR